MADEERQRAIDLIRRNISAHGRHVYVVAGDESPRFAYTIGGHEVAGFELVFAGGAIFPRDAVVAALNDIGAKLKSPQDAEVFQEDVEPFGSVRLIPVDRSWMSRLLLGALDYFGTDAVSAFQVVPTDPERQTIDIPNMSRPYHPETHPVWTYLDGGWPYDLPKTCIAITDLDAMLGYGISEVMRWEPTEFEIFSGEPPKNKTEMFRVPLSTLLLSDSSLAPIVDLRVGTGLIRAYDAAGLPKPWQPWAPRQTS